MQEDMNWWHKIGWEWNLDKEDHKFYRKKLI